MSKEQNTPGIERRRFRRYPQYKDSGLEWLGKIPAHWESYTLKRICQLAYGDSLQSVERSPGDVEVLGSNGVVGFHDEANTLGPCVVIGRKGSFGKVNFSEKPVYAIDTTFFIDKRFTGADLRWLYYDFVWLQLDTISKDSAIPGLDRQDAYARYVPFPTPEEQHQIASFLDCETAKIDALIEKKKRLIELLQEKRTALITHAVTKGLDPTVPMKDSGVEWLGQIPAHWELKRLKTVATVQLSNVDKKSVEGQEFVRLCNYTDVYYNERINRDLDFMTATATAEQLARFTLHAGDVLITKDSESWIDIAVPAFVAEDLPGVLCGYHLAHIRPKDGCDGEYISRAFASIGPRDQFQISANGITRFGLGGDAIRTGIFAIPPILEQRAIAAFLDHETAKIDELISRIREAITSLREYRTALISAAVTGKIDVRETSVSSPSPY